MVLPAVLNPFQEINWRPGLPERRRFAASLVVGFPCVAAVLSAMQRWHGGAWHGSPGIAIGGIGAALGMILWLAPHVARPFYVVWHGVACAIGFVIGNLVLASVYLLVFAPLGFLLRTAGRRTFARTFDRRATTYWVAAPPPGAARDYYRQF